MSRHDLLPGELPPKAMVIAIMDRLMPRVPADCSVPPGTMAVTMMAYLSGVRWEDDGGVMDAIKEACTVRTPTADYEILSWKGALQMLSYPTPEAWAEHAASTTDKAMEGVTPGDWTPWFCQFCLRKWPDGSEPDACPDCDHPLTRFQTREKPPA